MALFTCHNCAQQHEHPDLPAGLNIPDGSLTACWRCDSIYISAKGVFEPMTDEQRKQEPYSTIVPRILEIDSAIRGMAKDRYQDGKAIPADVIERWSAPVAAGLGLGVGKDSGFASLSEMIENQNKKKACIHCAILNDAQQTDFLSSPKFAADYIASVAKAAGQLFAAAELAGAIKPGEEDNAAKIVSDVFSTARTEYLSRFKGQNSK